MFFEPLLQVGASAPHPMNKSNTTLICNNEVFRSEIAEYL